MIGILHKNIQLMVHTRCVLAQPFVIRGHTINFFQYIAVDYQCDLQLNTSPEKVFCQILPDPLIKEVLASQQHSYEPLRIYFHVVRYSDSLQKYCGCLDCCHSNHKFS